MKQRLHAPLRDGSPCRRFIRAAGRSALAAVVVILAGAGGCGLFETRTPENPTAPSGGFTSATEPLTVITNLQLAVEQRDVPNYVLCFSDGATGVPAFTFVPSSEGAAQYASLFQSWTITSEQEYFQNLTVRVKSTSTSGLVLTQKSQFFSSDSAQLEYDYILTFEHTDPSFPTIARGNLRFTLGRNGNNIWSIYRWTDFKTTNDTTWSVFKGKFSN